MNFGEVRSEDVDRAAISTSIEKHSNFFVNILLVGHLAILGTVSIFICDNPDLINSDRNIVVQGQDHPR